MDDRWSLDELYPSMESDAFQNDLADFKAYIKNVNDFASDNFNSTDGAAKKITAFVEMINGMDRFVNLFSYASLTLAVDVMDERASKTTDVLYEIYTEMTRPEVMFKKFLNNVGDLEKIADTTELLREHAFALREMREEAGHMLSEPEEMVIAKMQNTGSNA